MSGTRYSKSEDNILASRWGKDTAQVLADRLGRTRTSVYQRAFLLGLCKRQDKGEIAKRKSEIARLNAKGWSDSEVASEIGMDRREVTRMRSVMGVSANGRSERYRKRVALKTRLQCDEVGAKNLAEIKSLEVRKLARAWGWPETLTIRSLQIVETLYRHGPMTRRQLAAAIGIEWKGSKTFGNRRVPGGSYLASLAHDGLVVRLPNAITHKGKGNHEDVYMLGLEIEPCQISRNKSCLRRSKTPLLANPVPS